MPGLEERKSPLCNKRNKLHDSKQTNFKVLMSTFFLSVLFKNNVKTNSLHLGFQTYASRGEYSTLITYSVHSPW